MGEQHQAYLALARKYRPQTFDDLYGQDALVQTLRNAISQNRIHHAYVLTGIRGTGKTTTARIISQALNCENGPAIEWPADDPQAIAIQKGNHPDVLEFDAASHRGVEDIADLFEGVAYAPVQGRYKVYIVDEVHMLSKQAFNALLKTLEEPPANVVFIFATTEVNKIPVTILSRCLRFDLRRIPVATLTQLYSNILQQEKLEIEDDALHHIAQAADGSARDGLSLLDQAIALANGEKITTTLVGKMLGLADRQRVVALLKALTQQDPANLLSLLQELHELGQDPLLLVNDMLAQVDLLTRLKVVPGLAESQTLSELERTQLVPLSQSLPLENLARLYQALLHTLSELQTAPRPQEALAMAAIRLQYLAKLPSVQTLLGAPQNLPQSLPQTTTQTTEASQQTETAPQQAAISPQPEQQQPQTAQQTATQPTQTAANPQQNPTPQEPEKPKPITSWEDMISLLFQQKSTLSAVLTQQGRCVNFEGTKIDFSLDVGLHEGQEIRQQLQTALHTYTGQQWQVNLLKTKDDSQDDTQPATLAETQTARTEAKLEDARQSDEVKEVLNIFPGAEVVEVNDIDQEATN